MMSAQNDYVSILEYFLNKLYPDENFGFFGLDCEQAEERVVFIMEGLGYTSDNVVNVMVDVINNFSTSHNSVPIRFHNFIMTQLKLRPDVFLTDTVKWNNTHCDSAIMGSLTTQKTYCKYCFNSRIYEPSDEEVMSPFYNYLTDKNDFSSCSVGHCYDKHRRFMISSGNGVPVKLEFEMFDSSRDGWYPLGVYYPKFCPECGRRLNEYEKV